MLVPETEHPELIVTGKLFEYIKSGRPVLGLVPEGEAAKIIRETRSGFVIHPDNLDEIKKFLWGCYQSWKSRKPLLNETPDAQAIEKYNRQKATKKLAMLFDDLV